ncbi:MAG TPA: SAM-dependent methyltransferase [Candidatus Acidoferrales bacterium]
MPDSPVENVSDTAFWVAHYRAVESSRRDALFRDPLAGLLAGDHGKKIAEAIPMSHMTAWVIAIRTAIIDAYIKEAIKEGVDTVLNLGAGLDTRPYRMDLPPSLVWIEADYPKMIEYKEQRLVNETPRCGLERVKIDLGDDVMRRAMFASIDARVQKLLVLTEGVVPYLTNDQVASLAGDLRSLSHISYWIADYFSPEVVKFRQRAGIQRKLQNAPFQFRPSDWFGFFTQRGWRSREARYLPEEGERLGRPIPLRAWQRVLGGIRFLFASSTRRDGFRRFSGYVLLVPATVEPPAR